MSRKIDDHQRHGRAGVVFIEPQPDHSRWVRSWVDRPGPHRSAPAPSRGRGPRALKAEPDRRQVICGTIRGMEIVEAALRQPDLPSTTGPSVSCLSIVCRPPRMNSSASGRSVHTCARIHDDHRVEPGSTATRYLERGTPAALLGKSRIAVEHRAEHTRGGNVDTM